MTIQVQLHDGNWWVLVLDRWIGYYPASLFSNNEADPARTLAQGSDQINWYGEIYQTDVNLTTSDMGSGEWPWTGWTHSAFIKNLFWIDADYRGQSFDGSLNEFISDPARYNMETHLNSGSNWGSFMWIGGPGADGKVGA